MHKRMRMALSISLLASLVAAGSAFAGAPEEGRAGVAVSDQRQVAGAEATSATPAAKGEIPAEVTGENWAYREIAALVEKYAAEKKLPQGRSCTKAELAECLLAVMDKIVKNYQKEGDRALLKDDLEKINTLQLGLEAELAQLEGYRTMRGTIQGTLTLVESEAPPFEYKVGVNGILRGEGAANFRLPDLSYAPGHNEGRFLYRVKPYVYWHPTDYLDIHLEGQGYGYAGGNQSFQRYSLYQGYVEARMPDSELAALKAGRQEFVYGSAFVLGSDSAFDGLSFDAARLRLKPTGALTLDILGGRYATPFSSDLKGNLAGAYLTYAPGKEGQLEAYFIRDAGAVNRHPGERLDMIGLRSTGKLGPLAFEFEPIYESGKLFNPTTGTDDEVSAYGGHIDLSGEFESRGFKHKLLVSYAVGSGDRSAANKEFRTPDNDTALVGDMHVVGDLSGLDAGDHHASGIQVYTIGWGIDLAENWNLSAAGHKFVAISTEDGFSRHLGVEGDVSLTYAIDKDLSLTLAYDRFFTERFFRDATGSSKDISYAYAMLTFNIDKTKLKAAKK
jgi:hypothetical protein